MTTEDQRQEYRLETQLTVFLELGDEQDNDAVIVISRSLDISANGLRIITDRELVPGSILRSCVQTENIDKRFMLITEVKWLQPWQHPGEFLVGLALFESENSNIQEWKEFIAEQCQLE
ncbi:MAG: PilZ domain-containing protein [Gammaproteobacteria bacterium]|nr:MAG: PilZ domain-containing protein [Gammaproteobacteria bacterium]